MTNPLNIPEMEIKCRLLKREIKAIFDKYDITQYERSGLYAAIRGTGMVAKLIKDEQTQNH